MEAHIIIIIICYNTWRCIDLPINQPSCIMMWNYLDGCKNLKKKKKEEEEEEEEERKEPFHSRVNYLVPLQIMYRRIL